MTIGATTHAWRFSVRQEVLALIGDEEFGRGHYLTSVPIWLGPSPLVGMHARARLTLKTPGMEGKNESTFVGAVFFAHYRLVSMRSICKSSAASALCSGQPFQVRRLPFALKDRHGKH